MNAVELVTHLGAYPVVVTVGVATWLVYERERGPWPVVAVLAAVGLASTLKLTLGLPRPPGAGVGGYGFPSGHALGSTVAYGYAAVRASLGPTWLRSALASAIVVAVAGSRVVLGVHYVLDVVAGVSLGLGLLAVVVRLRAGWSA